MMCRWCGAFVRRSGGAATTYRGAGRAGKQPPIDFSGFSTSRQPSVICHIDEAHDTPSLTLLPSSSPPSPFSSPPPSSPSPRCGPPARRSVCPRTRCAASRLPSWWSVGPTSTSDTSTTTPQGLHAWYHHTPSHNRTERRCSQFVARNS